MTRLRLMVLLSIKQNYALKKRLVKKSYPGEHSNPDKRGQKPCASQGNSRIGSKPVAIKGTKTTEKEMIIIRTSTAHGHKEYVEFRCIDDFLEYGQRHFTDDGHFNADIFIRSSELEGLLIARNRVLKKEERKKQYEELKKEFE